MIDAKLLDHAEMHKLLRLLYRFYIDRDKKAEEAILNFVQDRLDKEGLL